MAAIPPETAVARVPWPGFWPGASGVACPIGAANLKAGGRSVLSGSGCSPSGRCPRRPRDLGASAADQNPVLSGDSDRVTGRPGAAGHAHPVTSSFDSAEVHQYLVVVRTMPHEPQCALQGSFAASVLPSACLSRVLPSLDRRVPVAAVEVVYLTVTSDSSDNIYLTAP